MIIRKITQTKKHPDLYQLIFDDRVVLVTFEELIAGKFTKNTEVSDEVLEKLLDNSPFNELLSLLKGKLILKMMTESQVRTYIKRKYPKFIRTEEVINILKVKKLIDDVKYKEYFMRKMKRSSKPIGPLLARQKLAQAGIRDDEQATKELNENTELITYTSNYLAKISKRTSPEELKTKVLRHLMSRGFDYHAAKSAVDTIFSAQ